jgi:fumarate hydratase class II
MPTAWGEQTASALEHFAIGTERVPAPWLRALLAIKRAAALANRDLGRLDGVRAQAIAEACGALLARDEAALLADFPLSPWQSGSLTQSHMNVNEVLARAAAHALAGGAEARPVHPNDHVNLGQSSNDVVPSALHLAVLLAWRQSLAPAVGTLLATLAAQRERHAEVVKLGRTHLQDAVPMRAGQEIGAWRSAVALAHAALLAAEPALHELALGGTAVGTGLNGDPRMAELACRRLAGETGLPVHPSPDPFAALAGHEALFAFHAACTVLAVALARMANDLRLLASGPRAGFGEYRLPANEPGSSIMPGKVNPTQCEALAMVAWQVLGDHTSIGFGAVAGHLQLNTAKPLIGVNVLRSVRLLADAITSFERHALRGLEVDVVRMRALAEATLMRATALAPHVGYDAAARVAQRAHREGVPLREAALAEGIPARSFDRSCTVEAQLGSAPAQAPG